VLYTPADARPAAAASTMTANRRRIRDDVERTSKLTRFISTILRAAGVFRFRNLAPAAPPVEGIGEITTRALFDGGKAGALLPRSRLQQAIILQCRGRSA
jgi:hypothetical protein